eukprot:Opistho-1_new@82705
MKRRMPASSPSPSADTARRRRISSRPCSRYPRSRRMILTHTADPLTMSMQCTAWPNTELAMRPTTRYRPTITSLGTTGKSPPQAWRSAIVWSRSHTTRSMKLSKSASVRTLRRLGARPIGTPSSWRREPVTAPASPTARNSDDCSARLNELRDRLPRWCTSDDPDAPCTPSRSSRNLADPALRSSSCMASNCAPVSDMLRPRVSEGKRSPLLRRAAPTAPFATATGGGRPTDDERRRGWRRARSCASSSAEMGSTSKHGRTCSSRAGERIGVAPVLPSPSGRSVASSPPHSFLRASRVFVSPSDLRRVTSS